MSLDTVRTELKSIILLVSGIGKVHDYERYTHDWKQYQKFFTKDDKVNVWQIERPTFTRYVHGSQGPTNGVERVIHDFFIRGFYAINDELATEKTFQDIVEGVCQALRNKPDLNGKAEMVKISSDSPVTGRIYKDYLGAVLCHIAEVSVSIQEKITF
jgi:hypothetical protein